MKKVISFSLWGNDPKYTRGAIRNAELAREIYPGWECWFYLTDPTIPPITNELSEFVNVRVILDSPKEFGGWKGMFARFQPILRPEVEVMISRDCDSRLSHREKAAVDEWLASDKTFHAMHDHPHHSVPILGGMWGMKQGIVPMPVYKHCLEQWHKEDRWQTDQEWLTQVIWARYQRDFLIHDTDCMMRYWHGQPFPTPLRGVEFVGAAYDENDIIDPEQTKYL